MSSPVFITPKLIVKNISQRAVRVLDTLNLKPGEVSNVYLTIENLEESKIIDHLRAPEGDLYKEVVLKRTLEIQEIQLVSWTNSTVSPASIPANNTPTPGQVLSFLNDSTFSWITPTGGSTLIAHAPLFTIGDDLYITQAGSSSDGFLTTADWNLFYNSATMSLGPASASQDGYLLKQDFQKFNNAANFIQTPASTTTDGYLRKEDYQFFLDKRNATTQRIWQYQDFAAPVTGPLTLSQFQNGTGLTFNSAYIVNGSATIVLQNNTDRPPTNTLAIPGRWLPGNRVIVSSHTGNTSVVLNQNPESSLNCRVFFLVNLPTATNLPLGYEEAPQFIRTERADFLDQAYVNQEGDETINGNKNFADVINASGLLTIPGTLQLTSGIQKDGYYLKSNSSGVGTWAASPTVANTPPASPFGGQTWVDSTSFITYCYDQNRAKWLSVDRKFLFSGRDAVATNIYLRIVDSIASSTTGYRIQRDATIVGISIQANSAATWTFEVRRNDSAAVVTSFAVTALQGGSTNILNTDIVAGDELQFFCNGTAVDTPVGIVELAWRV